MELLVGIALALAGAAAWAWWEARARCAALEAQLAEAQGRATRAEAQARAALEERDRSVQRVRSQATEEARYAHLPLVNELIPVVDDFDRALVHGGAPGGGPGGEHPLTAGVRHIRERLLQALRRAGVRVEDPLGQPFDPTWHEAVDSRHGADTPHLVVERWGLAFWVHERLVRPAPVVVSVPTASQQAQQAPGAEHQRGDEHPAQDPGPPAQRQPGPEPAPEA